MISQPRPQVFSHVVVLLVLDRPLRAASRMVGQDTVLHILAKNLTLMQFYCQGEVTLSGTETLVRARPQVPGPCL